MKNDSEHLDLRFNVMLAAFFVASTFARSSAFIFDEAFTQSPGLTPRESSTARSAAAFSFDIARRSLADSLPLPAYLSSMACVAFACSS